MATPASSNRLSRLSRTGALRSADNPVRFRTATPPSGQDCPRSFGCGLTETLEKHPIGQVFIAPLDVFLSDVNVYQPDVIFIADEHRSIIKDRGIEGAPDLVVETLSPSTSRYDLGTKRKIYARTGVQELWLVDPDLKKIQVYDLVKNPDTPVAAHGLKTHGYDSPSAGIEDQCRRDF